MTVALCILYNWSGPTDLTKEETGAEADPNPKSEQGTLPTTIFLCSLSRMNGWHTPRKKIYLLTKT